MTTPEQMAVSQPLLTVAIQHGIEAMRSAPVVPQTATQHSSAFDLVASMPWAIEPEMLRTIAAIARRENEAPEAVAAKLGRPLQNTRTVEMRDGVAVVPVTGPVFRYANLFTEISGATSLEVLARDFFSAVNDPQVRAVVLNIDSPGGQASGIAEFAQLVSGSSKPVVAYVDGIGASAAYWIAAAAGDVAVSKTAMVGSIGAVLTVDVRKADGTMEIVSSQSPRKRPDATTAEGRQQMQDLLDSLAQVFVEDVAAYRKVSVETVLNDFGQGGMLMGAAAVAAGMADRVSTLEEVIAGLSGSNPTGGARLMATDKGQPTPEKPAIISALTAGELAEHNPALLETIRSEARAEGVAAGATQERVRIQAVLDQSMPGHEAMVKALAFDGKTTGPEAAVQVLAAEKEARRTTLDKHKADAPKPVKDIAAPEPAGAETFEDKVAALQADGKSKGEAIRIAASQFPDLHAKYVQRINAGQQE